MGTIILKSFEVSQPFVKLGNAAFVEEAIKFWEIELITGLTDIAQKAQEKILSIPKRLEKVAEYIEKRTESKTFSFDFIYNRILVFE